MITCSFTESDLIKEINKDMENVLKISDSKEQRVTRTDFLSGLDDKVKQTSDTIRKVDISLELEEISKYISLSRIASTYFGKSREWLYQRIKGYAVNGKPAVFSESERKQLSEALEDISRMAHETSLKVS